MKSKNLLSSFKFAFNGIFCSFKSERNIKIHILATILVIIMGIGLKISLIEWAIIILAIASVIGSELFNTALEVVVDMFTKDYNEYAKKAKDIAAGAVLIFAISAGIIGFIIFIPKIILLLK